MTKIDPPNWWAGLPKAMLLVKGEHLDGAKFRLSDGALRVERTHVSENGHWAELWLSGSPAKPETVQVVAERGGERATMPYRFEKRRAATDGFEGFSSKDVMYLIMTDRFADGDPTNDTQPWDGPDEKSKVRGWHGGDLRGVMEHLDYLQGLGVTTVWITPVYQNHDPQSYHGYGATDMYAVDEHFGTLGDLKALADALHQRGLKLVLDTVPNHVAAGNPWVTDEPEPDWFHGTKAKHTIAQGDFGPLTDPHAAWRDRKDVTQGWFADVLPDMNQESPAVAEYLTQNAVWWEEETGADGLRIDTFPYVGREFWHGFHAELHGLYPRLTTVGEVFNPDATITSSFAGGVTRNGVDTGLDTPFDFPSYFALREVFLKGESMTKLADVLRLDALYPHPERLVPFLGNHDTTRFMGEPGATAGKMKLAFVVLTTMRGMPQIYSGDEIAMPGGGDPDNRRDFPGGFANGAPSAFVAATRRKDEAEMYDWVSGLLKVRAAHDALREGEEQLLEAKGDVLVYLRGAGLERGCGAGTDRVLVMVNNGDQAAKIAMKTGDTGLEGCRIGDVLWGGGSVGVEGGELTGEIPARQAAVVVVR
jgi:glycosidase